MRCIECGTAAFTGRPERTAQGYRWFRCWQCGKQLNERSGTLLNRTQYPGIRHKPFEIARLGPEAGRTGAARPADVPLMTRPFQPPRPEEPPRNRRAGP